MSEVLPKGVTEEKAYAGYQGGGLIPLTGTAPYTGGTLAPVTLPCKAIMATTSLPGAQSDWLVVLTQGADGKPQGRVFEAGSAGVREAVDAETRLAATVAGGKVLAVKAELKRIVTP